MNNPGKFLADFIKLHYLGQSHTVGDNPRPPRLRLQDWQIVEEVSILSTKYVLLRSAPKDGLDSLTARELDALRRACSGATNKEIGYEMGISVSTVGVLLSRASRKLHARGRCDLIRTFRARQL